MTETRQNPNLWSRQSKILWIFIWTGIITVSVIYFALIVFALAQLAIAGQLMSIVKEHLLAILGTPTAIIVGFLIVQIFRGIHGPIVLETKAVTFRGATGPVILWIMSFLAVVLAMWTLWGLG